MPDRGSELGQCASDACHEIEPALEIYPPHQHGDGNLLAALQALDAAALALGTLEAAKLRGVLAEVLGHQQHAAVLLDEEGVARADQAVDDLTWCAASLGLQAGEG